MFTLACILHAVYRTEVDRTDYLVHKWRYPRPWAITGMTGNATFGSSKLPLAMAPLTSQAPAVMPAFLHYPSRMGVSIAEVPTWCVPLAISNSSLVVSHAVSMAKGPSSHAGKKKEHV